MTGGGSVITKEYGRVTHGFELHCDGNQSPNNLEVNWGKGNKFHMTNLTLARCSDNPGIDEAPPVAGFDTYFGAGIGRLNGEPGYHIFFRFTDAGEPGKKDWARIWIRNTDWVIIFDIQGNLKNGNHQAHAH